MNICFFSDARAEHTRRWTKYFASKGHRVDLITWNPNVLDNYDPVRVHVVQKILSLNNIFSRIFNLPRLFIKVKKIIQEINPDVIHAHSAGAYAWMAMLVGFRPYIVTPWGTDILVDVKKSKWNRLLTSTALRCASLITCDAQHMKNEMVHLGVNPDLIKIIMFGVDFNRFIGSIDAGNELKKIFKLNNSPIVLSTRTLTPIHDVETFVKAIPLVHKAFSVAKFVIATDGSERKKLENMVEKLGVSDIVRFQGYLTEEEMIRWLYAADIYVSTSLADAGLAGSTAEAMACGLPVVVTDNGENRDWVVEGKGGYSVFNGASDIIADKIIILLRNKKMREEFGCFNRQIIEKRNNYAIEMDKMEDIYRKLVEHII